MMRVRMSKVATVASGVLVLLVLATAGTAYGAGGESHYEGTFRVQPNGDVKVQLDMTLPMRQYQQMRESVSNLYLMLRELASGRSDIEVVDKNANWDDANRMVKFTMTWLGAAENLGTGWQIEIPEGTKFSNMDEDEKVLHFFASGADGMGGMEKIFLPPEAEDIAWNNTKRLITYKIPTAGGGSGEMLWMLGAACVVVGLVSVAGSFVVPAGPKG